MSLFKKLAYGTAAAAIMAAAPVAVYAQDTTSDIRGSVSAGGAPVSGATITIMHVPSGSISTRTSGANGSFSGRDLRVGGPYTVTVTANGYAPQRFEDIFLSLGAPLNLPVDLTAGSTEVIVITGSASTFTDLSTGPSSRFTADDINGLPSISRDPRDVARLSPFANLDSENGDAISMAGANSRYNSFTVDGIAQNDLFGLNASGFPSENRGPVSLDALEAISVEIAPFDVQYSGFSGGTINAVTRSGGNEFHGSLYYFSTDESLVGDTTEDVTLGTSEFSEVTRGAWLSGPIIQDTLFFSASYEDFTRTSPLGESPTGGPPALFTESQVTQAEVDQILGIMQSVYGLDLTNFDEADLDTTDEKILVAIDWNITADHRAKLTYNTSVGGSVAERNDGASIGTPSTWYNRAEDLEALSLQVFSDWSDNFSTEIKISNSTQTTGQDSVDGSDFANFQIATPTGGTVSVGPDYFRHANALANELWQYKIRGEYLYDNHTISFGFERQSQDIFNLFVPGSEGSYEFDSIADLAAQTASSLWYNNAVTNDENDGAAAFSFSVNSFYAQDEIMIGDRLTATFGIRHDVYSTDDSPTANANFMARYGYTNAGTLDGLSITQPRASFNYESPFEFASNFADFSVNDVVLRGGLGRFSGGNPLVWISNSYSNDGVATDGHFLGGPITGVDARILPVAATSALVAGDGSVNALAPDFEIPSVWRASFGADVMFDIFGSDDWLFTFDALYDMQDAAPFWNDANCPAVRQSFDGRPIYNCETARQDIILSNTDKGHSFILSFQLQKDFDNGFSFWGSYANQDVTDAHSGTSTTATSNYSDYASFDRQNPYTTTSNYQVEHDIKARLSWRHAFFEDYETRVELFMNRRSGRNFSYTYDYDNGPGSIYRNQSPFGLNESAADDEGDLFYVPMADGSGNVTMTSDPNINYTAGFDIAAFNAYLQSTGLINYAGQITPRNGFDNPWSTIFDLRFQQEFPAFFPDGARGIFYMDIENFGNLLNDDWGRSEGVRYEYFQPVVDLYYVDPVSGAYTYDGSVSSSENRIHRSSLWQIQFGARYQF
jgi:outer membrane receptor for ferrienterochelin and colicin